MNGMKWGRGEEAALQRMREITREELESIDMTLDFAREWSEMYEEEVEFNPANDSARGRLPLMRHVARLLGDTDEG